ncbi:NUDIX domain-containing protein [Corynebacterium felinum]|uniref:8-oxo-dGTP diphosphatase n=1 Tax=Corynebacterium felinum TaxID=131318 RepID=A0ABU2B721_9CORY|nr:NUDIX domain-containing protein [Corynebacterium felinum]MDF5820798.1 NUDIX domain-containing protein [Corynebacterium felinum]MDR7354086.1 8-oxo-dGTP diphosphatase [Corynebacterium felinum]WJY96258.1 Putative 8-oxo-dGTP diphosphatase YtkD [Corynebacterium felinum]
MFNVSLHPVGTGSNYRYVLIITLDGTRILLSRHRDRHTWENQGGHVEKGESVDQAAARELFEEAGVKPKTLEAVCDHRVSVDGTTNWGRTYLATVDTIQPLPDSEIAEVRWCDQLPSDQELTYPWITPLLYHHCVKEDRDPSR